MSPEFGYVMIALALSFWVYMGIRLVNNAQRVIWQERGNTLGLEPKNAEIPRWWILLGPAAMLHPGVRAGMRYHWMVSDLEALAFVLGYDFEYAVGTYRDWAQAKSLGWEYFWKVFVSKTTLANVVLKSALEDAQDFANYRKLPVVIDVTAPKAQTNDIYTITPDQPVMHNTAQKAPAEDLGFVEPVGAEDTRLVDLDSYFKSPHVSRRRKASVTNKTAPKPKARAKTKPAPAKEKAVKAPKKTPAPAQKAAKAGKKPAKKAPASTGRKKTKK